MFIKKSPTFKREVFRILLYSCGLTLLLNFSVISIREYFSERALVIQNLKVASKILSHNLVAPLAFNDLKDARKQMRILESQLNFTQAHLYDHNGKSVISIGGTDTPPPIPPGITDAEFYLTSFYDSFEAWQTVSENEELHGYLQLRVANDFLSKRFFITLGILLVLMTLSFFISLMFGGSLVNKIAKSLQYFVSLTKDISIFGTRNIQRHSPQTPEVQLEEFTLLFSSFDDMLQTIRKQDQFIRKYNDSLETKIAERTQELDQERAKVIHSAQLVVLGEMAAKIAHEINNPLTIIASLAVILQRNLEIPALDKDKMKKQIQTIADTTKNIAKIVAGIRNLSRDASADPEVKTTLGEILQDVLTMTSSQLKMTQVELQLNLDAQEFNQPFMGKPSQLAQVFGNLINNAIHAIQNLPHKWIRITAQVLPDSLVIDFTDAGPCIPKEIQTKIFLPFYTTKSAGIGTGLGLSISRSIIQRHNGSLEIVQDIPNTCFRITLPIHQE